MVEGWAQLDSMHASIELIKKLNKIGGTRWRIRNAVSPPTVWFLSLLNPRESWTSAEGTEADRVVSRLDAYYTHSMVDITPRSQISDSCLA